MASKAQEQRKMVPPERQHPFEAAGIFSKLFYLYMWPIFRKGLKQDFVAATDILPPLKAHSAQALGDRLESSWKLEVQSRPRPSLWRAIWRVYWGDFAYTALLWILLETFIKTSQPLCMSRFLDYYKPDSSMSKHEAYCYAGLIVLILFLQVIVGHYYLLTILQLGVKIRVSVSSLTYRKALRLSRASLAETTIGQMVNLLSNDASRFDGATVQVHCLWYCPIQALIVMGLCYFYLGATAMTGVVLLVLFIPFQMWMAKKVSLFRHQTALRTDERIRLMNEIISGIQVIKMYTWEKPFAKLAELSRRKELRQIQNISFIRATIGSLNLFLSRCAIYLCLLTLVLSGNVPTAQYVYTLTTFYTLLQYAITILFPQGITQFAEVSISMRRFHQFLMYEEVGVKTDAQVLQKTGVSIEGASAKWLKTQTDYTLKNINFAVSSGELAAVVGPVGSGKSSLLQLILGELEVHKKHLNINGVISYAAQEPWLFLGSLRHNILFGQDYDADKYQEVVRVCALEKDFALLPFGDKTMIGERGVTLSGGQKARINLARAVYKEADIYLLDDPLSAVDANVGRHIFDQCITGYLQSKVVVLVTHQLQYLQRVPNIYLLENGSIKDKGAYGDLGQGFQAEFLSRPIGEEVVEEQSGHSELPNDEDAPRIAEEKRTQGNISWTVYRSYIFAGGHWCKILALILGFVLSQMATSFSDYFQSIWVNLVQTSSSQAPSILTERTCLYIYSALIGLTVAVTLCRSFAYYRFAIKASLRMHNNMFSKIVKAPMKFFYSNPSGRILNRFSSDMGAIDEQLPLIFLETIQIAFLVTGTIIVIGSVNSWMFLPTVIMFAIFYLLRIVYLKTSRDVKRLEATTRSPIYSHLSASLQGLSTIRACGVQATFQEEFDSFQDINVAAWFTFVGCARSFGLWLDLHCVVFVALVTFSFLFLQTENLAGNVGLSITQALSLTGMFQWGMRQWSELENRMTCVERVKEYADETPESDKATREPSENWPESGMIRFEGLCLKYDTEDVQILNNLSFTVKSQEKVGVVGRTGAGKSSIIAALFRLAVIEGHIWIDSIDTQTISLHKLRSSISIIPQEPVLFSGTLRKNLDPFKAFSDEAVWTALEEVELKGTVSDWPHGLDTRMAEGGANLSVGQRQLVCLARAILRNNKILILDEATANVDPQTDSLIQATIRRRFSECTVLTVAHRLHSVMDSDKVLVMDEGRAVEFAHPHELLQKKGAFHGLVQQSGAMDTLTEAAHKSYKEGLKAGVHGERHV